MGNAITAWKASGRAGGMQTSKEVILTKTVPNEAAHTIQNVRSCGGDLMIALVADSHVDNSVLETIRNISAVDQAVHFDCCVYLGDFPAGGHRLSGCGKGRLPRRTGSVLLC